MLKFSITYFGIGQFNKSLNYIKPIRFQRRNHSSINNDSQSTDHNQGNDKNMNGKCLGNLCSFTSLFTANFNKESFPPPPAPLAVNDKINFNEMIKLRRSEAKNSILVQVNSEKSFAELHSYSSQFGRIKGAHHYTQDDLHYILLEYENVQAAQAVMQQCIHNKDIEGVAVHSPFLWFRAGPKPQNNKNVNESSLSLSVIDGNKMCSAQDFMEILQSAETLDDQMIIAHRLTALNDIGTRLRFLAARQIEESIAGMFPDAKAYPFGSSVNGFGTQNCDLDLILHLNSCNDEREHLNPAKRLVFHTKENLSNGRSQTQRHMENLSDMMQLFMPGVCQVRRILQARVPIIKYHHEHLNLEVDLSMSNLCVNQMF